MCLRRPGSARTRSPCFAGERIANVSGFKFEALATLDQPWAKSTREDIEDRSVKVVNNIEQYISVVRTGVGKVKVVFGGEVDCVQDFKPNSELVTESVNKEADENGEKIVLKSSPLSHYVELKTSRVVESNSDAFKFERKTLKAWAQSFLLGVPKIIYGFRDDQGVLKSVEEYKTEEIPSLIKNSKFTTKEKKWNGVELIAFYGAVLDWIKNNINQEGKIYRLSYRAGASQLELSILPQSNSFLSEEFTTWRNTSQLATE